MNVATSATESGGTKADRTDRSPLIVTVLSAMVVAAGAAVAFLVGRDGSPGWQVVRVAVILTVTVAAAYLIRRGSPMVRGVTAFSLGLPSIVAGAGIAIPHLGKSGWSLVVVAGVVALVTGTTLAGYGAVRTVRSTPGWWRLATTVVLLVVTYAGLFAGIQAVASTNVPPTHLQSTTPADRGLQYEDAALETADGLTLSGWYIPASNRAAVVLLHGAGSTRSDVLDHAVALARHGYGVLLFDARGHGRSGGRAMDFGWYGDQDVAAAVSFLQRRADVDPGRIAAVGMSMGGEEAIGAAASQPAIRAVVAEGATNRVSADWDFLSQVYGPRGWVQQQINGLTFAVTDVLTDASPPIALRAAAAVAAPRPVLLIAGGGIADEANAANYIQRGNANVQVWHVPGTGHTRALFTQPDEWQRRVTAFLDGALPAGR